LKFVAESAIDIEDSAKTFMTLAECSEPDF